MNDHEGEEEKVRQLTDDLKKAALNLIRHSGINNFRIRIEGSMPEVYITLGEGRSSYSADSVIFDKPQGRSLQLAPELAAIPEQIATQDKARAPLIAYFSRLKKALAA
ncbi:MAG: hypothetical protein H7232_00780 [Aeromicrobium sp.]|nr:hypothetical protein [Burkholderiales bacterium]